MRATIHRTGLRRNHLVFAMVAGLAVVGCATLAPSTSQPGATGAASPSAAPTASAGPTPPGLIAVGTFSPPASVCAGVAEWIGVPPLIKRLGEAWNGTDFATRRAILDEVWAEDGLYQDPFSDGVVGRDALATVMRDGVGPGQYVELLRWDPAADMHHGAIRLAWRHCCPNGASLLEGTDMATVGADGRISRVVSFWSRYVEEPAEFACDGPRISTAPSPDASHAETQCKGRDVDWSGQPAISQDYGNAWNERDAVARRAILDRIWAVNGTYADPLVESPVVGPDGIDGEIAGLLEGGFGEYFEPRPIADGDVHHGHLRMPWTYCDAAGNVVWVGEEIVELDPAGRILHDFGFFKF